MTDSALASKSEVSEQEIGELPEPGPRRVLVTHADQPLGRRLVKRLSFDPDVTRILAIGSGPAPRALARPLRARGGQVRYRRIDLTKHRPVSALFQLASSGPDGIDTVIHLPNLGIPESRQRPALAGVPDRVAEARLVLQHCLETSTIRQLIVVGSAYVYQLAPGNANRVRESSPLNLDPALGAEARAWVDCDMLFHAEIGATDLALALLRVPSMVGSGGALSLSPGRPVGPLPVIRALGFDPMCPLVADHDVALAIVLALRARASGIYNIAGAEAVPLSVLSAWSGGHSVPLPHLLIRGLAETVRYFGRDLPPIEADDAVLRHGISLDTSRAERELGFRPAYRITPGVGDDGRRQPLIAQV